MNRNLIHEGRCTCLRHTGGTLDDEDVPASPNTIAAFKTLQHTSHLRAFSTSSPHKTQTELDNQADTCVVSKGTALV